MNTMRSFRFLILILFFGQLFPQDLSLEECIQIALSNKESLKISALDLELSKQNLKGSYSSILPSVQVSGSWSEIRFPPQVGGYNPSTGEITMDEVSSFTSTSSGISLSQNIYDGGIWWNTISQAKNSYKIAEQMDRQVQINIIRDVHRTYFNYLKTMQLLEVARLNLKSSQQQLALVERKFELGSAKKTDLLKAEVRFGQSRVDVVNNDASVQSANLNLKNAIGLVGAKRDISILDVDAPLDSIPDFDAGFEILQKSNPSVLAKQHQTVDAQLSDKIAGGARLPSISVNLNYGGNAEDFESMTGSWDENWRMSTSLSVSIPIFSGNTLSTSIQKAKLNVRKQESEYLQQLQDLSVQLRVILDRLNNYQEIIPINEKILFSAEEDLRLAQERYSLGSTTLLEVLDAQVSLVSARSSLIRIKYDALIEQANLQALLGTLEPESQ